MKGRRTLTEGGARGLFYVQKYRFLTIAQFAAIAGVTAHHAGQVLAGLETRGMVGFFGGTVIRGHGRTPKVYYLKRRGWEVLRTEGGFEPEEIGEFVEIFREFAWSPQMYHRLRLLDLFVALEMQVRQREQLVLRQTFIEYRRVRGTMNRETTDYVSAAGTVEDRIVPDGAFILENVETGRKGLFFVEMDMGTERIATKTSREHRATIYLKLQQYDKYLTSGRFAETYAGYGEFRSFLLLFVTYGTERITNIRSAAKDLPARLHPYYRFALFQDAVTDMLGPIWKSRDARDVVSHALVESQ
jgi:hypothetical protein